MTVEETIKNLHLIQMYDGRELVRETAEKAIAVIEELVEDKRRLENKDVCMRKELYKITSDR